MDSCLIEPKDVEHIEVKFTPEGWIDPLSFTVGGICGTEDQGGITVSDKEGCGVITRAQAIALHQLLGAAIESWNKGSVNPESNHYQKYVHNDLGWIVKKSWDEPYKYIFKRQH